MGADHEAGIAAGGDLLGNRQGSRHDNAAPLGAIDQFGRILHTARASASVRAT